MATLRYEICHLATLNELPSTCLQEPFVAGNFFEHNGLPYCETHYHAMRGSLCAGCHKPISGRCITAMFRKFHPEHFLCSFCLKQVGWLIKNQVSLQS